MAQLCLAWNLQQGVTVIPKPDSIEMAQENFSASEVTLSEEEMQQIAKLDLHLKCYPCRERPYSENKKDFEIPLFS